jgi:hypothetical protein
MTLSRDRSAIPGIAGRGKTEGTEQVVSRLGEAEQASADNNCEQDCERDIPFHSRLLSHSTILAIARCGEAERAQRVVSWRREAEEPDRCDDKDDDGD